MRQLSDALGVRMGCDRIFIFGWTNPLTL